MKAPLTVALVGKYFGWGGGMELLRNIGNALALKARTVPLSVCLLLPVENRLETLGDAAELGKRMLRDFPRLKAGSYRKRHLYDPAILDYFRHIEGEVEIVFHNDTDRGLRRALREVGADVVLPVLDHLDPSFPLPWLGYLYDFQHRYYPQFFDAETCRHRDLFFQRIVAGASAVLVNSVAVKDDIGRFHPDARCRIFNMPFAPMPLARWFEEPEQGLAQKYALPERYFLISNQFWVHKSHRTAIEALGKGAGGALRDVHLVCTGNTADHRFPGYFAELGALVASLGIGDRVHFLGHIPKLDQIQIMKGALAVIQPTLSEGGPGGGSVYDAVALGVPAIVSDIPINLEIDDDAVRFFTVGSAEELRVRMEETAASQSARLSTEALLARGRERAERLGDTLLEAIEYVMLKHGEKGGASCR